jgi:hypothetical protein
LTRALAPNDVSGAAAMTKDGGEEKRRKEKRIFDLQSSIS